MLNLDRAVYDNGLLGREGMLEEQLKRNSRISFCDCVSKQMPVSCKYAKVKCVDTSCAQYLCGPTTPLELQTIQEVTKKLLDKSSSATVPSAAKTSNEIE